MPRPAVNQGDDLAGIFEAVGEGVYDFKKGDRVAAYHQSMTPFGSYGEYAISTSHSTFHLPDDVSFEEGATIPLAAITAAVGLYQRLNLPMPWRPALEETPLVIYGAATAVGGYAIQLAKLSNIHPLICIAGAGIKHVETLIEKGKGGVILDYRVGNEELVKKIKEVGSKTKSGKIDYAFDTVAGNGSYINIVEALDSHGSFTLVLPGIKIPTPETMSKSDTLCSTIFASADPDSWQKKTGSPTGNQELG
jgi:NADPH:quinone reductase-like Zn-dependent oxidoreductase